MIEQSLFKKHFLGKDGFHWWIGQVAPEETWRGNIPGQIIESNAQNPGIAERYKVRIMGYHTASKTDIPDEELPWATVLYPVTAGGGGRGSSASANITGGTFVFGFFLDGEDGQQPVIMGCIGYNDYQEVLKNVPDTGFVPFDGYGPSEVIGAGVRKSKPNNTNPAKVSVGSYTKDLGTKKAAVERTKAISKPSSADPLPIFKIQTAIRNAILDIEELRSSIYDEEQRLLGEVENLDKDIDDRLRTAAKDVAAGIKWFYAEVEKQVFEKLNEKIKAAYDIVTPDQKSKVQNVAGTVLDNIACFFRNLLKKLVDIAYKFLKDAVYKAINVPVCFVEKFVGSVLGQLGGIADLAIDQANKTISTISDQLDIGLDIASDFLSIIDNIFSLLKCDDVPNVDGVNQWNVLSGADTLEKGDIDSILERTKQYRKSFDGLAKEFKGDITTLTNELNFDDLFDFDECSIGPKDCGPPIVEFFGGKGFGAAGNVIIGAAGEVLSVDMVSFGVGYDDKARAKIVDECGIGNGAVIRPVVGPIPRDNPSNTAGKTRAGGFIGDKKIKDFKNIDIGEIVGNTCLDVTFTVRRDDKSGTYMVFDLVDDEYDGPGRREFQFSTNDVESRSSFKTFKRCIVPAKKYKVNAFLKNGDILDPERLRIKENEQSSDKKRSDEGNTLTVDDITFEQVTNPDIETYIDTVKVPVKLKTRQVEFSFRHRQTPVPSTISIPELNIKSTKGQGSDEKFNPKSKRVIIEEGREYEVIIDNGRTTKARHGKNDKSVVEVNDNQDSDWEDAVIEVDGGAFYNLKDNDNDKDLPPGVAKMVYRYGPKIKLTKKVDVLRERAVPSSQIVENKPDEDFNDLAVTSSRGYFYKNGAEYFYILDEGLDGVNDVVVLGGRGGKEICAGDEVVIVDGKKLKCGAAGGIPVTIRGKYLKCGGDGPKVYCGGEGNIAKAGTKELTCGDDFITDGSESISDTILKVCNPGDDISVDVPITIVDKIANTGIGTTSVPFGDSDDENRGIIDIIIDDPGGPYLNERDTRKGGGGRVWCDLGETCIIDENRNYKVPVPPDTLVEIDKGDCIDLPLGTSAAFGEEIIYGGTTYCTDKPGILITPPLLETQPRGVDQPSQDGAYPVILYLCDIIIKNPGFGYSKGDKVVIEPNYGATAEAEFDNLGRVKSIQITESGEGFTTMPKIFIESETGYNAVLLPKLCIDRIGEDEEVEVGPENVIQVIDCVGKVV